MTERRGEPYFFYMAIVMIILVVCGFGSTLIARTDAVISRPPVVYVHGLIFLGWFFLYAMQTRLIARGNHARHKRYGQASLILVTAMVVTGYLATRTALANPDWSIAGLPGESSTVFPAADLIFFLTAYGLGIALRRNGAAHKRFMLLAGLLIMDPAVARFVIAGIQGHPALILLIESGLYLSLFVYDFRKLRRPHWASLIGFALFIGTTLMRMTQGETDWWITISNTLFR